MARVIVTGGCGFIGSRLCQRLLDEGHEVYAFDNLGRAGTETNAKELERDGFHLVRLDLSHASEVSKAFSEIGAVDALFHLAAQVAVTISYQDPTRDFNGNALASFNVIEAVRRYTPKAYCLYASTNKVYGHIKVSRPVTSDQPLDPYTPYGVSKAVGELYFTEYGRKETGLETCSLRQSCIYGTHQYGVEDQGWLAWFAIANLLGLPLTIYGAGTQVRDLLYVEDLIDLYLICWKKRLRGVYPVGGGPDNAISIDKGLKLIASITGSPFNNLKHDVTRPGDQPYFVADLGWTESVKIDWKPRVGKDEGLQLMIGWIKENLDGIARAVKRR